MAFKYTCVALLLYLTFLPAQGKHVKHDKSKHQKADEVLPKVHDTIQFDGDVYDCQYFHTKNNYGTWCNCPFLACTGGQDCSGTFHCSITNNNYDYTNMKDEDCDCRPLKK